MGELCDIWWLLRTQDTKCLSEGPGTRPGLLEDVTLKRRGGGLDKERIRHRNIPEVMNLKYLKQ